MLSPSKGEAFAKISSVVALQARSDKRKSESLGGKFNRAEVKSNRVEPKTNRAETDNLCAIKFCFLCFRLRIGREKTKMEGCMTARSVIFTPFSYFLTAAGVQQRKKRSTLSLL